MYRLNCYSLVQIDSKKFSTKELSSSQHKRDKKGSDHYGYSQKNGPARKDKY